MNVLSIIIYSFLSVLALLTIFFIVRRVLFLDAFKMADPQSVVEFCSSVEAGSISEWRLSSGWMTGLVGIKSLGNLHAAAMSFRVQCARFHELLPIVSNTATSLGLIGTVASLATLDQGVDPMLMISLGIKTTLFGLLIATPAIVFFGATDSQVKLLLDQADQVIAVLEAKLKSVTVSRIRNERNQENTLGTSSDNHQNAKASTRTPLPQAQAQAQEVVGVV